MSPGSGPHWAIAAPIPVGDILSHHHVDRRGVFAGLQAFPSTRGRSAGLRRRMLHCVCPNRQESRCSVRTLRLLSMPALEFHWPSRGQSDPARSVAWFEIPPRRARMFFSARGITGPIVRKIQACIEEATQCRSRIPQSHVVDAVFDLTTITIVLPFDTSGFATTFRRSSLIDNSNGDWAGVLGRDNLLTPVSKQLLIPNHGLKETLQRPRRHVLLQRDGFRIFSLDVRQKTVYEGTQQPPTSRACKTI